MNVAKRSVLITGGSRGLGRALGEELCRRGASVVLVARHAPELERTVAAIRARGGRADGIVADVGAVGAAQEISARAIELAGPIDVVVQNASTLGPVPMPLLSDLRDEALESVFQVNVLGPVRLTRALVGPMVLRGEGLVVTLSSDAAVEAYPSWGAYGASKAALDHVTRVWAAELAESGVRFLSVDPGEMATRMHADAIPDADPATLALPEDVATTIADMIAREPGTGLRLSGSEWAGASREVETLSAPVPS